jgi:hypothetical protein
MLFGTTRSIGNGHWTANSHSYAAHRLRRTNPSKRFNSTSTNEQRLSGKWMGKIENNDWGSRKARHWHMREREKNKDVTCHHFYLALSLSSVSFLFFLFFFFFVLSSTRIELRTEKKAEQTTRSFSLTSRTSSRFASRMRSSEGLVRNEWDRKTRRYQ